MADCYSCMNSADGGQTTVCCYYGPGEADPDGACIHYEFDSEYKPDGCQSRNHRVPEDCYGELWQCWHCGRWVCAQEGSTNKPDLCDDCWSEEMNTEGQS